MNGDARNRNDLPSAPAALRNRAPIRDVLKEVLGDGVTPPGAVVETAAGTGEHACFLAPAFPTRDWWATDREDSYVTTIAARIVQEPSPNLKAPMRLDVAGDRWAATIAGRIGAPVAAIININMIHIADWSAGQGLIAGAAQLLVPGGVLYLYGPFSVAGRHTSAGNRRFDASLREQDPAWGIRDLNDVTAEAASHGLRRDALVDMPANNLSVVFRRGS